MVCLETALPMRRSRISSASPEGAAQCGAPVGRGVPGHTDAPAGLTVILIDAGPLVALLHRDDQLYLLRFSPEAQDALLEMVERGAVRVLPIEESDIPRIRALIRKYRDLPMDLADATLVRVAEREGIPAGVTLDRRDFTTYRVGRRVFSVIP